MRRRTRQAYLFPLLPVLLFAGGLECSPSGWAEEAEPAAPEVMQAQAMSPARPSLEQRFTQARNLYERTITLPPAGRAVPSHAPGLSPRDWLLGAVLVVLAGLAVWKLTPSGLMTGGVKLTHSPAGGTTALEDLIGLLEEDECVSAFAAAFRIGPHTAPLAAATTRSSISCEPPEDLAQSLSPEFAALKEFLISAPAAVLGMRALLQQIGRNTNEADRQTMLNQLHHDLHQLKGRAGLPQVLPAWQLAYSLECLTQQLSGKPDRLTPSTLRTLAAGVDLLQELCQPALRADICTNPPMRLLAVDDDPISRHAVAFALKKALSPPDLAVDGPTALALAAKTSYDVIFLDVQMPGMDGFELCSHIHATPLNKSTPVVFVTVHGDFGTRAKSTLVGGTDLIAKPFLTFEITVKALTLALRRRLQLGNPEISTAPGSSVPAPQTCLSPAGRAGAETANPPDALAATCLSEGGEGGPDKTEEPLVCSAVPSEPPSEASGEAPLANTPARLRALCQLAEAISQTVQQDTRQRLLTDLFLHLQDLNSQASLGAQTPAGSLRSALAGLLKKLLEDPKHATPSALHTTAVAVTLLHDLCAKAMKANLATEPPVRLLVVDDDPIVRRVMSAALQMAFDKPDTAASGEEALALVAKQDYDAIFLDIEMPNMDGHTACLRIREIPFHGKVPVVFVTSHTDLKSRTQSSLCGGNDFIAKPFLKAEITVKALTYALRHRLNQFKTGLHSTSSQSNRDSRADANPRVERSAPASTKNCDAQTLAVPQPPSQTTTRA
jgi:CheY-like chemotaxis protein